MRRVMVFGRQQRTQDVLERRAMPGPGGELGKAQPERRVGRLNIDRSAGRVQCLVLTARQPQGGRALVPGRRGIRFDAKDGFGQPKCPRMILADQRQFGLHRQRHRMAWIGTQRLVEQGGGLSGTTRGDRAAACWTNWSASG